MKISYELVALIAFCIGVIVTLLTFADIISAGFANRRLGIVYQTCTNAPGVAAVCTTKALFDSMEACNLYSSNNIQYSSDVKVECK